MCRQEYECALGIAWLGLQGSASLLGRLKECGVREVWRAPKAVLLRWGLDARRCEVLDVARRGFDLRTALAALQDKDQRFIPYGSPLYPRALMQLDAPPAGLFVRGKAEAVERLLDMPRMTVVGTRKASTEGLTSTKAFSEALCDRGIAVLSGMALGIDGRAHSASLKAGGLTVAVLGCGADVVYPSRHRWLYEKICDTGVVISELPPGSHPTRWTFPRRNRLLAALCDAILVIEGSKKSGALQTASWGLSLGRAVFSVPGPIFRESYEGCNALIYDGAFPALTPVSMVEDFLRVTRMERGGREGLECARVVAGEQLRLAGLAAEGVPGHRVLQALAVGPLSVDGICQATGQSVREVSAALGELEVHGAVGRAGPGVFTRAP